jgi:hypothetical protein
VPGVILNGNQTISVKQSLCTFHVCLCSGQVPSEAPIRRHCVTISFCNWRGAARIKHARFCRATSQRGPQARQTATFHASSRGSRDRVTTRVDQESSELARWPFPAPIVASDTSEVPSGLGVVQPFYLNEPGSEGWGLRAVTPASAQSLSPPAAGDSPAQCRSRPSGRRGRLFAGGLKRRRGRSRRRLLDHGGGLPREAPGPLGRPPSHRVGRAQSRFTSSSRWAVSRLLAEVASRLTSVFRKISARNQVPARVTSITS